MGVGSRVALCKKGKANKLTSRGRDCCCGLRTQAGRQAVQRIGEKRGGEEIGGQEERKRKDWRIGEESVGEESVGQRRVEQSKVAKEWKERTGAWSGGEKRRVSKREESRGEKH